MEKQFRYAIIIYLVFLPIMYLAWSFMTLTIDFTLWHEGYRNSFVIVAGILTFLYWSAMVWQLEDNNNDNVQ